jgi:hypothetical protein
MNKNFEIIDDYLDKKTFDQIKYQIVYSETINWNLSVGTSSAISNDGVYFTHKIYWQFKPLSQYFDIISPLIQKLNPFSINRIKINFYPKTENILQHDFHTDGNISHKGAIFYLNSNNGKTIFSDGTEIESIQNRMLLFDPTILHKSTTCTDDCVGRYNINFNYY